MLFCNLLSKTQKVSFKCQVFTWYGATVEMDGTTELDYTADEVCVRALHVFIV